MPSRFIKALSNAPRPIIMEIKSRDGNGRDLFRGRSLQEIVAGYEAAGAACISVVTGHWFGGSAALLRETASVTRLPLLKKDFITKREQIAEAREAGASALLLTAGILPRTVLRHLISASLAERVTPFVEITSAADLEGLALGGCVVAINNKDILTRERGPATFDRNPALLRSIFGSGSSCAVSASGIDSPELAARLVNTGFRALLIGTALLLADDIKAWVLAFDRHRRAGVGVMHPPSVDPFATGPRSLARRLFPSWKGHD